MASPLPLRANLEWLKKLAKERLAVLRAADPTAQLSDAQLAVAREYGFASWRKLKAHVELIREKLDAAFPTAAGATAPVSPDDPELAQLLAAVKAGELPAVTQLIGKRPELARAYDNDGQTALHVAAECNDPRIGVFLLAAGADPEARYSRSGHTALSWAVTCNATEFAQTLVRLGVSRPLLCRGNRRSGPGSWLVR
jgi:ankyrin repeat protein